MNSEDSIRDQLTQTLLNNPSDYSKILQLSTELISFDKNNVRFSVDAGVIDRLGRELVARPETAVSELIKNSYDADAKTVQVIFSGPNEESNRLTIEDDGVGMTREELVNGFMKISSTGKIHQPNSSIYKRKRAGKKGIGRFSVQRLGSKVTIITQTPNENYALRLTIDWDDYENDTNLLSIKNRIEEIPNPKPNGTTLIIDNLRDKWSETAIKRIYRYVTAILQPFPLSKETATLEEARQLHTADPGFKVDFFKDINGKYRSIANEESMIFKYAAATIEGYVDSAGYGVLSVDSEKLGINEINKIGADRNNTIPFKHLRNVNFKAYYFVFHTDFIPNQQRSAILELIEEMGGIRLYKNGFRVLPYGEPYFDWLKLDESVRKRAILPVHGNHNFFGFVEVSDNTGLLEETSSREGLQENEAFKELQNYVYRSLIWGVLEVARSRSVKQTTGQKNWDRKYERPNARIKLAAQEIEDEINNIEIVSRELEQYSEKTKGDLSLNNTSTIAQKLKSIVNEITTAVVEQELEEKKIIEEVAMLRVLSSLGLTIGEFTHEIRHYLTTLEAKIKLLEDDTKDNPVVVKRINDLYKNVITLQAYASYFDETVSNNIIRELAPQEIRDVIDGFVNIVKQDSERVAIEILKPEIDGYDLFTTPMHPSELASILFNLFTNAKKAIARANVEGKIKIRAGQSNGAIYIEFSDNGDGISEEIADKIFDPFFTTSSPVGHKANEKDEILGTGLGLKIVNDTINAYNGKIELISPPMGFSTSFRIELPEASEEEIEKITK